MSVDLVFHGRHVITPDGERACCVLVRDGIIAAVEPYDEPTPGARRIELGDAVLLPGVVDTHVHLNEPGREEWEGFESGTRAAAAGGVTTVVDMPLNSVPATTTAAALERKRTAAAGRCHVDVGFWGGITPATVDAEVAALWDAGACGFKCFLAPSGVPEFEHVDAADLVRILPLLAGRGAPLLVHAELPAHLEPSVPDGVDPRAYATYLATRPDDAEVEAVRMLVELCRETRVHVHVVHVSAARAIPLLQEARAEGLPLSAETCPHYLHFAAAEIGAGRTEWKCAPPIRSAADRDRLWEALFAGDLDLIASDHSPSPPELKHAGGSFMDAWGGIASLQLALPVVWTGARRRGCTLAQVATWMCSTPARLAGLAGKGAIEAGRDADFVVFAADEEWGVDAERLYHRHALTPYAGERLTGRVRATYLRGERVYDADHGHGPPSGRLVERTAHGAEWTSHS